MSNTQVTHKRVKCYHTRIGLPKHKVLGRGILVHLKITKKKVNMSIPFCYFFNTQANQHTGYKCTTIVPSNQICKTIKIRNHVRKIKLFPKYIVITK